jgi:hypothetical protein
VGRTKNVYEQSIGDKLFGSRGKLVGKTKEFFEIESLQDVSTNAALSFGEPAPLFKADGNESVSLQLTRVPGVVSYQMPKRRGVGIIRVSDGSVVSLKSPPGSSHVACGSADGFLLWQDAADLLFYDVDTQKHLRVGNTPLAVKGHEWCDPMYPSRNHAFYAGKAILQWKDGGHSVQKFDLASGAVSGSIAGPEDSVVCSLCQVGAHVFCVFYAKGGMVSILDAEGKVAGSFQSADELSASMHHFIILPKEKSLIAIEKEIHPHDKVLRLRIGGWNKSVPMTRMIKLPESL